jgi:hypothetical protein
VPPEHRQACRLTVPPPTRDTAGASSCRHNPSQVLRPCSACPVMAPVPLLLEPQMLEVTTLYNVRGGFETRCTVRLPKE